MKAPLDHIPAGAVGALRRFDLFVCAGVPDAGRQAGGDLPDLGEGLVTAADAAKQRRAECGGFLTVRAAQLNAGDRRLSLHQVGRARRSADSGNAPDLLPKGGCQKTRLVRKLAAETVQQRLGDCLLYTS